MGTLTTQTFDAALAAVLTPALQKQMADALFVYPPQTMDKLIDQLTRQGAEQDAAQ